MVESEVSTGMIAGCSAVLVAAGVAAEMAAVSGRGRRGTLRIQQRLVPSSAGLVLVMNSAVMSREWSVGFEMVGEREENGLTRWIGSNCHGGARVCGGGGYINFSDLMLVGQESWLGDNFGDDQKDDTVAAVGPTESSHPLRFPRFFL